MLKQTHKQTNKMIDFWGKDQNEKREAEGGAGREAGGPSEALEAWGKEEVREKR